MACGMCGDPVALAKAIEGLRIGGVRISWAEAWTLALDIIQRLHTKEAHR